jgi:hypothetical protein
MPQKYDYRSQDHWNTDNESHTLKSKNSFKHAIPHSSAMIYTSGQEETKSSCYKSIPHPAVS